VRVAGGEAGELRDGISRGVAAQPGAERDGADGVTVTRLSSWWNHLRCRSCGHTFRRGDPVRVRRRERSVVHLVPGLRCGTPAADDQGAAAEVAAFRDGLLSAWPAPPGLRLRRLAADDWRLPDGPRDLRDTNVCLQCAHTFRPGESVIVCPCPLEPAGCGRAVHRDPAVGLSCWEAWRPDGSVTICPVTQTAVGGVTG
jgi:hypothetical protein